MPSFDSSDKEPGSGSTNHKEVIKMAGKKSTCGCGCIPLNQNSTKTTKDEKKAKNSK